MNYRNLYIFMLDYIKQRGDVSRGVIIVRTTPLEQIVNEFEALLNEEEVKKNCGEYRKETSAEYPEMVIFFAPNGTGHVVIGRNEQGWKGDYGLTHDDVVVSVL